MILLVLSLFYSLSFAAPSEPSVQTWNTVKSIQYSNEINENDVKLFVPQDIPADIESNKVGDKVMDHAVSNFVKGEMTPNAEFFKTVKKVEESVKVDVEIPKKSENDISHKFNLHYRPFQNKAEVEYTGFFDAKFEYDMSESFLIYKVEKDLKNGTYLALAQSKDPYSDQSDSLTMINLRMPWN